jgi:pilus assembly protein Flp/PilA
MQAIQKFWQQEDGVTAIEYGLIAALIACAIILGITAVGTKLNTMFTNISTKINGVTPAA